MSKDTRTQGGVLQLDANYSLPASNSWTGMNLLQPSQITALISGQGATATLTAAQSGSYVLFDRAAGITFTLPPPQVGLNYIFIVKTSVTSNNHKVITDAATTFLMGGTWLSVAAGTGTQFWADGTTIRAITMNGTTTGGLLGSSLNFYCISSTQWCVDCTVEGSGTIATPFATS